MHVENWDTEGKETLEVANKIREIKKIQEEDELPIRLFFATPDAESDAKSKRYHSRQDWGVRRRGLVSVLESDF